MGELSVYRSSWRPFVRPSTLSNIYISKTSMANATKFHLKHHWGEGKAALDFGPDRIRTLVSMATDSYNGKNVVITFSRMFLIRSFSYLQETMTCIRAWMSSKFGRIRPRTTELSALERMKKSNILILGKRCHHIFSAIFNWILFIFAGNEDMYNRLDEFEIRPDATTGSIATDRVTVGKTAQSRFLERF